MRSWKILVPLVADRRRARDRGASLASGKATGPVKVAIMTDCKGAFGFGYELDIGGAQAAFAQFAGQARRATRSRPRA